MTYPKKVRLHHRGGKVVVELFSTFCKANGGLTREQGVELLNRWVSEKALRRRPDGGFDVLQFRPRKSAR